MIEQNMAKSSHDDFIYGLGEPRMNPMKLEENKKERKVGGRAKRKERASFNFCKLDHTPLSRTKLTTFNIND